MKKNKKQFEEMTSSEKLIELEIQKKSNKKWSFIAKFAAVVASAWLAITILGIVLGTIVGFLAIVGEIGIPLALTLSSVSFINESKKEKEKINEQISQVQLEQNVELKREVAPKVANVFKTAKTATIVKTAVEEKGVEKE